MDDRPEVTPVQVAAARLLVKRAKARGLDVDPAVKAIAAMGPRTQSARTAAFALGVEESRPA